MLRMISLTVTTAIILSITSVTFASAQNQSVRLSKQQYLDKCKGAWAGQMIGVCYGAPYEFKYNAKTMTGELKPWTPDRITGAIGQDDCYVEMTFLSALEKHGLDITYEQAGQEFAASKYGLWHANAFGRQNVRRGIMPPLSGHPQYNKHADDIDFQIEADLIGILCPGLPQESNRLCDIFGHIMNYGDGVYGGMFVAGMYAAAYLEDNDVHKVLQAGLDGIPAGSLYHQCIADVIKWHKEKPNDWRATWKKVEDKWQDDIDCAPTSPFNIDAKINGAYIAIGLLYGQGDFLKTIEIATRCGQDNDCNPSNAAGVLGCMKGYSALGEQFVGGIPAIEDKNFSYTNYSFKTLIPACQKITEKIIQRNGGTIHDDEYIIPVQTPKAPEKLEQWTNQMDILSTAIHRYEMEWWNPAWHVVACGLWNSPGFADTFAKRVNCLQLCTVDQHKPAILTANLAIPPRNDVALDIEIASPKCLLKVFLDNNLAKEMTLKSKTGREWTKRAVDLSEYAGKTIPVRIEIHGLSGQNRARACLGKVEVESGRQTP